MKNKLKRIVKMSEQDSLWLHNTLRLTKNTIEKGEIEYAKKNIIAMLEVTTNSSIITRN